MAKINQVCALDTAVTEATSRRKWGKVGVAKLFDVHRAHGNLNGMGRIRAEYTSRTVDGLQQRMASRQNPITNSDWTWGNQKHRIRNSSEQITHQIYAPLRVTVTSHARFTSAD